MPDSDAQASLILAAHANAKIDARSISYVEAHGTGTVLGDPIEVSGLKKAWQEVGVDEGSVGLGSLKANLGHLESAAGVAS